jgi:PAS domain S-box-containing protein
LNPFEAIFQTSNDSIFFINLDQIIEKVNSATTQIFGFTSEQSLGQSIEVIFSSSDPQNSAFFKTMKLMKVGQCSLIYETDLNGKKDSGSIANLKATLLGINSTRKSADFFILLCKDLTDEFRQRSKIEELKKKSEHILLQILPKDIIFMLNSGEKDITFTVTSASIIFIDIVQFSKYMEARDPSVIMSNLSKIFGVYDKLMMDYPLITKIKYIGDVFMGVAGLFHPEIHPSSHAHQMVQFALHVLEEYGKINEEIGSNLQVRIGINTGGPIIARVLGTENPLFDIIGDAINVAARLQSTDIPGYIQISESTYDLISSGPYKIERRGEIKLKERDIK